MWNDLWEWVRDALLKFFGPPDIDDEAAFRDYVRKLLKWVGWVVEQTETQLDDQVFDALSDIVEDDGKWAILYGILVRFFGDGRVPIGAELPDDPEVAAAAAKLGIPITLLVQIILLILKLLTK